MPAPPRRLARAPAGPERGLTVVEIVVALALLGVATFLALTTILSFQPLVAHQGVQGQVDGSAHVAALFMADRLRQSGTDPAAGLRLSLAGPSGAFHAIEFRVNGGFDRETGAIAWSEPRVFVFAYEPGEVAGGVAIDIKGTVVGLAAGFPNGADDDGDGLVDEGIIYYETSDATGIVRVIIATDVLPGSGFALKSGATATKPALTGDEILIKVEKAKRAPDATSPATLLADPTQFVRASVERRVALRNIPR